MVSVTGSECAGDEGTLYSEDSKPSSIRELLKLKDQSVNPVITSVFFKLKAANIVSVSCSDLICQSLIDFTVHAGLMLTLLLKSFLPKLYSLHMKICSHIWKGLLKVFCTHLHG